MQRELYSFWPVMDSDNIFQYLTDSVDIFSLVIYRYTVNCLIYSHIMCQ